MDLSPADVVGQTCYNFTHVEDLDNIRQSHEDCKSVRILQYVWGYSGFALKKIKVIAFLQSKIISQNSVYISTTAAL